MRYGETWPTGQQSGGPAVTIDPYEYGPPEYEPDDSEAQRAAEVFTEAAAELDGWTDERANAALEAHDRKHGVYPYSEAQRAAEVFTEAAAEGPLFGPWECPRCHCLFDGGAGGSHEPCWGDKRHEAAAELDDWPGTLLTPGSEELMFEEHPNVSGGGVPYA